MSEQKTRDPESPRPDQVDIFGKTGNGTLDFCLAAMADWENDSNCQALNIDIHNMDFNAIYVDALQSRNIIALPTDFSRDNWNFKKNREMFVEEFPEYALLGADYQMYGEDYVFDPETAARFKEECERVRLLRLSPEADLALRKLIYGLNEACRRGLHLIWVCD